ncbi:Translational repressor, partial [Tilletia horrida]
MSDNSNNHGNKSAGGGGGRGGHRHSQSRGGGAGSNNSNRRDSYTNSNNRNKNQRPTSSNNNPPGGGGSGDVANLQHLLHDIKSSGTTGAGAVSPSATQGAQGGDIKAELAAIGDRLALQEEQLQQQLQQQLNIAAAAGGGGPGARAGGPAARALGTLPSLDENAAAASPDSAHTDSASTTPNTGPTTRQGGPRFAGNAAFQSAVARHAAAAGGNANNANSGLSQDQATRTALAHQRQLSLQGRFADLGYNVSNANFHQGIMNAGSDYDAYDDGATTVSSDFAGNASFDPTRRPSPSQSSNYPHRRAGSDMSGFSPAQRLSSPTNAFGQNQNPVQLQAAAAAAAQVQHQQHQQQLIAGQIAIQQQIELLQMQQQQLLQQQIQFNPSSALGGNRAGAGFGGPQAGGPGAHRRIQSHAPGVGGQNFVPSMNLYGSNNNPGGFQSISPGNQAAFGNTQPGSNQSQQVPRGHGRRHSVNVVNKSAQQQQQGQPGISPVSPSQEAATSPTNNFGFPAPGATGGAPGGPGSNAADVSQLQPSPVGVPQRHQVGHFSHPSIQLASLSPEYLLAAGGLVSLGSLGLGQGGMNEFALADGFTTMGGGGGGRGGHNRTGSSSWRINSNSATTGHVVDLAQAQAQLASLHHFRAQAGGAGGHGGGHNKNQASFGGSFNPMLGPGFGGNLFGNQQGFGGNNAASQRKALFGSYLPQAALPPLLAAGKLVVGMLRINKRNRSDAYVSTEVLDSDIFISGSKDRNRALEGDLVAVELLDPNEVWSIKKEKEDKKKRKEESGVVVARKPDKAKDDLEVEGAQLRLIEDEEENDQTPPALAGHVVAIVERTPGQLFSGTLGLLRPSSAATKEKQQAERALREGGDGTQGQEPQTRPKIVWFRPSDKRVPLIAIPAEQAPSDFWDEGGQESYNNRLFVASIKRWPITSLHPFGTLVEEIGVIGNVEAETQALLKDSLASVTEDFGENVLKCIPPLPWTIPDREYEVRRDFRSEVRVFTIDPETAKDLDDAVSVRELDGGLLEVGVHIADVSYFVKVGNALDRDAKKRGTSVYLVQRAVPMLPPALSEELCSLVPGVDRLAFSA